MSVIKVRKKPVEVETIQWTGGNFFEIAEWAIQKNGAEGVYRDTRGDNLYVETLEGRMTASLNDWIIKGVKGEFYPIKPDILEETYERVEE